jgi:hypothetical protein
MRTTIAERISSNENGMEGMAGRVHDTLPMRVAARGNYQLEISPMNLFSPFSTISLLSSSGL